MAGQGGEVVTLQLGDYANHVGAHWWNLQKAEFYKSQNCEISSDVLFRRGLTLQRTETYTPRLIALDLKGSVRSLREEGSLYEDRGTRHSLPAWRGDVSVHGEDPGTQEEEAGTSGNGHDGELLQTSPPAGGTEKVPVAEMSSWVWSDLLQTQLHPKSLCLVRGHGGDVNGVESFSQGEAVFKTQLEDIEDRLHFFTEECDYLQGFQLLCDVHSGFSGVGVRTVEMLHDEYPGRGILSFGTCLAPGNRDPWTAVYQLMNCALALGPLSSHSSLFCPLSVMSSVGRRPGAHKVFPQLLYDAGVQYHSSAVLAVALNTLTVPYRMSSSGLNMSQFAEALTFGGRKMLTAVCSVPFPLASSSMSLPDALCPHLSAAPLQSVSPCTGAAAAVFSQSVVLRGIPKLRGTSELPAGTRPPSSLHRCESGEQVLQCYVQALYPHTLSFSRCYHDLGGGFLLLGEAVLADDLHIAAVRVEDTRCDPLGVVLRCMTHLLGAPCTLGPSFPQFFSPYVTTDGFTAEEPQTEPPVVGQIPVLGALQTSSVLYQTLRNLCDEVNSVEVRRWMNFSTAAVEQDDFREAVEDMRSLAHRYRTREGDETDDSD